LARAITSKARACARRGELEVAIEIAHQANNVAAAATPRQVQLDAVLALADIEYGLARFDDALGRLKPAAALARVAGERFLECQVLALTAKAYAGRGDAKAAAGTARAAKSIADVCGYTPLGADLAELIDGLA
jgi:tetratricopeptide (TPR) repeat protein